MQTLEWHPHASDVGTYAHRTRPGATMRTLKEMLTRKNWFPAWIFKIHYSPRNLRNLHKKVRLFEMST